MDLTTCVKAVDPLLLPILDNPISTDGAGNVRGIPVTLGDPNQFFSMQPAVVANNTMISTTAQCEAGNYSCIAIYGGVYTPSGNAFHTNSLGSWNGTKGFEFDNTKGITFFNDRMGIEGKTIPGLPFMSRVSTYDDPTLNQATLALGQNSSFLQSAVDLDLIPSKQWSYWPGDVSTGIAGHVILGGYDQNRVVGDLTSFTSLLPLGLVFEINSIIWTDSSGDTTDLMEGTPYTIVGANVETGSQYIELPEEIRTNFYDATDATYSSATGPAFYATQPSGTLDITTTNGYKVSIASQDLFDHGLTYDSSGNPDYDFYENWVPRLYQSDSYADNIKLTFGAPFLARQYLVTDIENEQFYLAEAVQGTGSSTDIRPLCTGGVAPKTTAKSSGSKTNAAAIGGGVGGGVAVLLIVGIILFFVLRHHRRTRQNAAPASESITSPGNGYQPVSQASQYPSPSPLSVASPVFTEKHMMHQTDQKLGIPEKQGNHIEELPSSGSDFSRSSQTHTAPHNQNNQALQYYAEMPAQHYP